VQFRTPIICSQCQQPIVSEQDLGFVYFKIPSKESYCFFHRRFGGGDCWEAYLKEGKSG
jgi:hypothetical protein